MPPSETWTTLTNQWHRLAFLKNLARDAGLSSDIDLNKGSKTFLYQWSEPEPTNGCRGPYVYKLWLLSHSQPWCTSDSWPGSVGLSRRRRRYQFGSRAPLLGSWPWWTVAVRAFDADGLRVRWDFVYGEILALWKDKTGTHCTGPSSIKRREQKSRTPRVTRGILTTQWQLMRQAVRLWKLKTERGMQ